MNELFVHTHYGWCYYALDEYPMLYGLYIEEMYRGKGLSKVLINFCINEIRNYGYSGNINIQVLPQEECMSTIDLTQYYKSFGLNIID